MDKRIIILTGYERFFGQTRKPWVGMNLDRLSQLLREGGYDVEEYEFHQLANQDIRIQDSIILYSFSQRSQLRRYIRDIIWGLQNSSNLLIPSLDLLHCHENKGFQELYKQRLGIDTLGGYYFSSSRELRDYELNFPMVLKSVEGSNGKYVFLVHNREELQRRIRQMESGVGFLTHLDFVRRKYFRGKRVHEGYPDYDNRTDYYQYRDYSIPEREFVLQEFVPDLRNDYRITVFYDHYFGVKRYNRPNDFRASGAKKFDFEAEIGAELLDYARELRRKLNTPVACLDIGMKDGRFYLFEFQGLHFGIRPIIYSHGFYRQDADGWTFVRQKSTVEEELAGSLLRYLDTEIFGDSAG